MPLRHTLQLLFGLCHSVSARAYTHTHKDTIALLLFPLSHFFEALREVRQEMAVRIRNHHTDTQILLQYDTMC